MLLDSNSISKDVVLMFDEIYLQKREEYAGGELVGADTDGNLYKGIMCFMIVGLQENVPFVVKAIPETGATGEWIKGEIEKLRSPWHWISCEFLINHD